MKVSDAFVIGVAEEIGGHSAALVGSCAIFGDGADIDIAVVGVELEDAAIKAGYTPCSQGYPGKEQHLRALRRGDVNLLLCSPQLWHLYVATADLCRYMANAGYLPQANKGARVLVHEKIREAFGMQL